MLEVRELEVAYGEAGRSGESTSGRGRRDRRASSGPNGAGKSTLVNAIAGMHRPAGEIEIDGIDMTRPGHGVCDHGVAIVPEGRRVFPA